MNKKIPIAIFALLLINQVVTAQSNLTMWYNRPADFFEEALVLGNGKNGATVFGGVQTEKICLNDITLWSGGPVKPEDNPDISNMIPQIRKALANEDYRTAERLNQKVEGKFSESYMPLGTLYIEQDLPGKISNYYRALNLGNATAQVRYDMDGVTYNRKYFVSYPDKVLAIRFSVNRKHSLNFKVKFSSLLRYKTSVQGDILQAHGYAPYFAYPDYMWGEKNPIRFDANKGTRFTTDIKVKNKDGQIIVSDSAIIVRQATDVVLYVSMATSFNGFDKDPVLQGLDSKVIAATQLKQATSKSYSSLLNAHVADYQSFFNRVSLKLNDDVAPNIPVDERLKLYSKGKIDNNLEVLYFQFGRYLLISSSRTDGVPANLQGLWNQNIRPAWSCNYTMNINAEENYWMAESANLSEMHQPFLSFIRHLAVNGCHTAKAYYGINRGWTVCHNSDIWAITNPVGYGKITPRSSCWNMGGAWTSTHLWEHYAYTGDKDFLCNKAYPLMKGAAEFCLAWMVEKDGHLITSPSTSPEAQYKLSDGFTGATFYGGAADMAMIRECLTQTLAASKTLNVDKAFRDSLQQALKKLLPYRIGKKGNLQEWYYDWEDEEPQHRHQSHLFGLYPGHQITPESTPDLARAAKTTLEIRGDKTTGWSKGWRINLWARLRDGNHTYKMLRELLTFVKPDDGKIIDYIKGGGTYPNLLDAHPPFQIDGNFGGTAGFVEMLLQSDLKNIYILPALPDAWHSGKVSGLCARGGFEVSMEWKNGALLRVKVLSKLGGKCCLNYRGKSRSFSTSKGKIYTFNGELI